MIRITPTLAINERELREQFIRASGPGGQKVNKAATAVQLQFDLRANESLPEEVRRRLIRLAGKRLSSAGILTIDAREHRSQERNRQAALARFIDLVRRAAQRPKKRRPRRPSAAARERRLEAKRRISALKRQRRRVAPDLD